MVTKDDAHLNLPSNQVLSEGVHGSASKRMLRHAWGQLRRAPSDIATESLPSGIASIRTRMLALSPIGRHTNRSGPLLIAIRGDQSECA